MDSNHIREFLIFTETMSYARAAKALFISSNALAAHVARLEEELGVPLVSSRGGRLSLTPAGRAFTRDALNVLASIETLFEGCRRANESGSSLTLACVPLPRAMEILGEACRTYEQKTGCAVELSVRASGYSSSTELERRPDADAAFCVVPRFGTQRGHLSETPGFSFTHLYNEPLLFSVSEESDLYDLERIVTSTLDQHTLVALNDPLFLQNARLLAEALHRAGAELSVAVTQGTSNYEYLYGSRPDKVAWWNESTVTMGGLACQPGFRFFHLDDADISYDVYLMYRTDSSTAAAVAQILEEGDL